MFSEGHVTTRREVRVSVKVDGVPRFEKIPGRMRECRELIPARLTVEYVDGKPDSLTVNCATVLANGGRGDGTVVIRWYSPGRTNPAAVSMAGRPIPSWAIGFLEESVGVATARHAKR